MKDFCLCFNSDKQQKLTDEMLNIYVDDDDVVEEKLDEIGIDSCFLKITSTEQNASNDKIDEDFTSSWNAELEYEANGKVITLASAYFWLISIARLQNNGWYD